MSDVNEDSGASDQDEDNVPDSLDEAVSKLDWKLCWQICNADNSKTLDDIVAALATSDVLVHRFHNEKLAGRRRQFVALLEKAVKDDARDDLSAILTTVLYEANLLESCFRELSAILPSTEAGRLTAATHAWALIECFAIQVDNIQRRSLDLSDVQKGEFIDPTTKTVKDENGGEWRPDDAFARLATVTASSLTMLAHQNQWIADDGRVILPARIDVTDADIDAASITQYLGGLFNGIATVSERWRFWPGSITEADINYQENDTARTVRTVVYEPRLSPVELLDYVATERLDRYIIEALLAMNMEVVVESVVKSGPASLAPINYISNDEAYAACSLGMLVHFDVLTDESTYGGLTFREWLRGYSWLQRRAFGNEMAIQSFSQAEALEELAEIGLPREKALALIRQLCLHRGKSDLFDTPLICTQDEKFVYHAKLFSWTNVARIILSRLANLGVTIGRKGRAFEYEVIKFLNEFGLDAQNIEFKKSDQNYEYDAVFIWGDVLFIMECKSYSLPMQSPMQLYWYMHKMDKAIRQVLRLAEAAVKYKADLAAYLGTDASWTYVVPCVLNSLPWSAGLDESGVFILDYSCVRRFFDSRTIYINMPRKVGAVQLLARHHLRALWPESGPTAKHFLEEMRLPWQVKVISGDFEIQEMSAPLSENLVFKTKSIARSSPDIRRFFTAIGVPDASAELQSIHRDLDILQSQVKATTEETTRVKTSSPKKRVRRKRKRTRRPTR